MTNRTHELNLQWEAHMRAAQDARALAADHQTQADRIWADLRLLSQRRTEAPQSANSAPAATHIAQTRGGVPQWRRDAE